MAVWDARANELFLNALDRTSADQRQAYLDAACGADAALRQAVGALLEAHAAAGHFLQTAPGATGPELGPARCEEPGALLAGRYKLLQPIGEGGMGVVWMAEQLAPVRRQVAVKLIKPGTGSGLVAARFEAERQALALMDHPHIARVLDAGTTEGPDGRPFFVMELVKGVPITRYCDENQLTPRERLALMVGVCQAVQHAHTKGVIHRDLKPTNVLVAAYDGRPVPKVIDFGIAKAVGQRLTEQTLFTGFGSILGTLEYMSPEQAEFNALDVDTRADVYSLGVVLYELLTGTTPLTRQRLQKAALLDVLREIREVDPPTPSTRLSQEKENLAAVSAQRRRDPGRLAREVSGELDWIVMKALEKDRSRRYATAADLARDIERYLHDEAVEACPPSTAYRVRKFVSRHRALVAGTALVVLALLVGVVGTTWGLLRALAAEQTAQQETARADGQKKAADAEKEKALAAWADTRAFSDFLLFQVLAAARLKGEIQGAPVTATIADSVVEAEKGIEERFKGRPTAEADVRHALGVTWRNMKRSAAAEKHFRRALELRRRHLGPDEARTLSSQRCLGATLDEAGRTPEALPVLEDALKKLRAVLGPDDKETLLCLDNLGAAYARANRLGEALALQREALQRGGKVEAANSPDMLRRQSNLAATYARLNRHAEAAPLLRQALEGMKAVNPTHAETLECMRRLASAYAAMKAFDQSAPVFEELLALEKKAGKTGPFAPLETMQMLAVCYAETGRVADLRGLLKDIFANQAVSRTEIIPNRRRSDPPGAGLLAFVGYTLLRDRRYGPAEEFLRQCLTLREKEEAPEWLTGSARSLLGQSLAGQKKYPAAEPLLLKGYETLQKNAGEIPPAYRQERLTEARERLVQLYEAWGKRDEANKWRKKP
jgi:tetratricopeptide (TPR) repeat protein